MVEGDSDLRLVHRMVGPRRWSIYIAGSRGLVIQTLRELGCPDYAGGIVDRDFDDVVQTVQGEGVPVFALDSRDLESALIESQAFVQVLEEFASSPKLRQFGGQEVVRMRCREIGEAIGKVRREAQHQGRSIRFDDVALDRHIDHKTLQLKSHGLISALQSVDSDGWSRDDLAQVVDGDPVGYRGKDALAGLSVALRRAVASHSKQMVSVDILGRTLRLRGEACEDLVRLLMQIGERIDQGQEELEAR